MAATMDMHDLGHDTLMGLNELDSHLSMFESSNLERDSSTPVPISISTLGDFVNPTENSSQTIIVESPGEVYSHRFQLDVGRRGLLDEKPVLHGIAGYVFFLRIEFPVCILRERIPRAASRKAY